MLLCAGACYKGLNLVKRAIEYYLAVRIWTIRISIWIVGNMLTQFRLLCPYGNNISKRCGLLFVTNREVVQNLYSGSEQ